MSSRDIFLSFLEDDGGSCWAEGAVFVGEEEEENLGLRWIVAGNDDGG